MAGLSRLLSLTLFTCLAVVTSALAGDGLDLDDFTPPASGGSKAVQQDVVEKDGLVQASNAQDGLNYAYQQLMDDGDDSVRLIAVPSGLAIIAVGSADYSTYDNRNATLLGKRAAFTRAMLQAQKHMTAHLEGATSSCTRAAREQLVTLDTGSDENQTNMATSTEESCRETVKGMIRGYVVYRVDDLTDEKRVVVALASSTATRGAMQARNGAVVRTTDPKKAWKHVVTEITSGVVPPMGARMISNPETGENIIIGFGSAIVRQNRNKRVARKLARAAKKQAAIRANNSLVAFLSGDAVYWQGGFDQKQMETSQQFAVTGTDEQPEVEVLDQTRQAFVDALSMSDDYRAVTKGKVPPGVRIKTFIDQSGDWAMSVAVYRKSAQAQARVAAGQNRAGTGSASGSGQAVSGRKLSTEGGLNEKADNPKSASGQVSSDHDL